MWLMIDAPKAEAGLGCHSEQWEELKDQPNLFCINISSL